MTKDANIVVENIFLQYHIWTHHVENFPSLLRKLFSDTFHPFHSNILGLVIVPAPDPLLTSTNMYSTNNPGTWW